MTTFHLHFAGQIKRVEHRTAGTKNIAEVSLCKKRKVKEGDPEAWDWIRATIWEPSEFTAPKLVKGAFISGHGDLSTRVFTDKDGKERTSIEVRCGSYDCEVQEVGGEAQPAQAQQRPTQPANRPPDDGGPPF